MSGIAVVTTVCTQYSYCACVRGEEMIGNFFISVSVCVCVCLCVSVCVCVAALFFVQRKPYAEIPYSNIEAVDTELYYVLHCKYVSRHREIQVGALCG